MTTLSYIYIYIYIGGGIYSYIINIFTSMIVHHNMEGNRSQHILGEVLTYSGYEQIHYYSK